MKPADFVLLVAVCLFWALNLVITRWTVTVGDVPPLFFAAVRVTLLAAVLAPFLLPAEGTALRGLLTTWFDAHQIRPRIVGEFEDSALLKEFGQQGLGVFAAPAIIRNEIEKQYGVREIGLIEGRKERFYAISVEKKLKHPAVVAIAEAARNRSADDPGRP